ncbi:MAG: nickel-responsive transcriptional regulator NikR [Desulfovibrionaceae bacterium]|nr:nickel-responsive transcriptional regulator NikR [Desulfovibrionaceae bacterium]
MGKTTRFGVSLDQDLLEPFDALCERKGYTNRSEALRDLIRKAMVEEANEAATGPSAGTLTMIYDHHKSDLAQKLMDIQHDFHDMIVATLHVHLDHHNCLEVLVLKGESREIRDLSNKLVSCRGVKYGTFSLTTTGQDLV